ncbi:hypothetical protein [Oceanobacillus alkalisoli]|uniref:hypothetical protein n=1 Tax=Oceanobacillus alkalisoli TaxID=2925113 RepID=UPI001F121B2C|nr:hypothetical protein [Oceanobacillus alkalisoli]MCF3942176.1 hypothetical protein [Oceanobacillus alkalisoli]
MHNQSKVRLPESIWELSKNEQELKQRILHYMRHYPGYTVLRVEGRIAICDIGR